jgi:hypothetical protein
MMSDDHSHSIYHTRSARAGQAAREASKCVRSACKCNSAYKAAVIQALIEQSPSSELQVVITLAVSAARSIMNLLFRVIAMLGLKALLEQAD